MKKLKVIFLAMLCILVVAVLAAPVSAGLIGVDDVKITAVDGSTSPALWITDQQIDMDGTMTINVSELNAFVASGTFTTDNVIVTSFTSAAIWTGVVADNTLTLTSTGAATLPDEAVFVTFTGAQGNPWINYTAGEKTVTLTANRTDGGGESTFHFVIQTGGLKITPGEKITTPDGVTSPVITITDAEIAPGGTITIDLTGLNTYVANGTFTQDNVNVTSNAADAIWTGMVGGDPLTLTLTSSGGPTHIGDTVTVTFTGATNPWVADSFGDIPFLLTATRTDGLGAGPFYFHIETTAPPPDGISITKGETITATDGSTTPVITITDAEITPADAITIDVSNLNPYVVGGLTNDNVNITSNAVDATWTGAVGGDPLTLTLTSTGVTTAIGETINVTFLGTTANPWIPNTNGEQPVFLVATRSGGYSPVVFTVKINTTPPIYPPLVVDFSATPRSGNAPLKVNFTDLSTGRNMTNWSWDFGDGANSTDQNPVHIYNYAGSYGVQLAVSSDTPGLTSKGPGYITVINGAKTDADTQINGLTIINCGGPQTVTVNTSIITNYVLSPDKLSLEIQAPPESGFKNITFSGHGFSQVGDLISGDVTGVHLVSVALAPTTGFSDSVGKMSSFWYSLDLPSYPCNAKLSTRIFESAEPEYDNLLRQVALKNGAGVSGTAFTAEITKTNFPPGAIAKVYFSVNSNWISSLSDPGKLFIWRIADDKTSGQFLPTNYLGTDPVNNIDYFEADSPLGFSTFGVSSVTNSNNPFQIIAFIGANIINQGINGQTGQGSGSGSGSGTSVSTIDEPGSPTSEMMQGGGIVVPAPVVTAKPPALSQPAMTTNVGMIGWLLAIVQNNPIILVGVVGVIAVAAYFGWWKRRL